MPESNWEQRKKHALTSLNILLDIWQARRPLTEIISTGPECNNAVLALGLETDLPLPYDEEKMSGTSLAAIFGAKDHSGGPGDEVHFIYSYVAQCAGLTERRFKMDEMIKLRNKTMEVDEKEGHESLPEPIIEDFVYNPFSTTIQKPEDRERKCPEWRQPWGQPPYRPYHADSDH